ncbi:MAG: ribose-5-phosphate isomerase RpiA, partial [Candidatus Bathyarchaeota archaeon]|nr:ribose-5-phosphate isomerase RpiA [Candidatus Bathyarchaeota archaeon]
MVWREEARKRAALEAVKHVQDGFIVGLGSGSTAAYVIQEIGEKIRLEGLRISGVPTSHQAMMLAVHCGVPLTTLNEHPQLDLAIDGADQIDRDLNLIKGGGGALTREKIVASAANLFVIVADETKTVEKLGTNHTIPIEVLPFALPTVMVKLRELKGKPVLREGGGKVGPSVTDNGNFVVDVDFGPVDDVKKLDLQLKLIPGVIETGLFVGMADVVYLGKPDGFEK